MCTVKKSFRQRETERERGGERMRKRENEKERVLKLVKNVHSSNI